MNPQTIMQKIGRPFGLIGLAACGLAAHSRFSLLDVRGGFIFLGLAGLLLILFSPSLPPPKPSATTANWQWARGGRLWLGLVLSALGLLLMLRALPSFLKPSTEYMYNILVPGGGAWLDYAAGWLALSFGVILLNPINPAPKLQTISSPQTDSPSQTIWHKAFAWRIGLALGLILLVGLALRVYDLEHTPFGLWDDEGINGDIARYIVYDTDFIPLFISNMTGPHLSVYALAMAIFGDHEIMSLRLTQALFGVGTIITAYGLGTRLYGARFGLLMALMMMTMRWSLTFSRVAMTGIETAFFTLGAAYFLLVALQEQRPRAAYFAGLMLGSGLWFYAAFRPIVPLLLVFAALYALQRGAQVRRKGLLLVGFSAIVALAVIYPLGVYALQETEQFTFRTRQVSITNEEFSPTRERLIENLRYTIRRHIEMFHFLGDNNGRHNDLGRPMLDPIMGFLFGAGLVLSLRYWRRPEMPLFALVLFGSLLTASMTVPAEAPQGLRAIGVTSAVGFFAALGAYSLGLSLHQSLQDWRLGRFSGRLLWGLGAVLAISLTLLNAGVYFGVQRSSIENWSVSQAPFTSTAWEAKRLRDDYQIVYSHDFGHIVMTYVYGDSSDVIQLPRYHPLPLRIGAERPIMLFVRQEETWMLEALTRLYPNSKVQTFRAADYGLEESQYLNIFFHRVEISPEDLQALQGLDEAGRGFIYLSENRPWYFEFNPSSLTVKIDGQAIPPNEWLHFPDGLLPFEVIGGGWPKWYRDGMEEAQYIPLQYIFRAPVRAEGWYAQYRIGLDNWAGETYYERIETRIDREYFLPPLPTPFSVQWRAALDLPQAGEYHFALESQAPASLFLDGELLFRFEDGRNFERLSLNLEAGTYELEIRFMVAEDFRSLWLYWSPPWTSEERVLGSEYLRPLLPH